MFARSSSAVCSSCYQSAAASAPSSYVTRQSEETGCIQAPLAVLGMSFATEATRVAAV